MTTFADLGSPFKLFQAPVTEAARFEGAGNCTICKSDSAVCFDFDGELIVPCRQCNESNGLTFLDRKNGTCRSCRAEVPFPTELLTENLVCASCLKEGRVAITQDTVLGMVRWEDAIIGFTHGLQESEVPPGYDTAPSEDNDDDEDPFVRVAVNQEDLLELVSTPGYISWQGEQWQFCCRRPMIYMGSWNQEAFNSYANDGDGKKLFDQAIGWGDEVWKRLDRSAWTYLFRCQVCSLMTGHWDED